MSISGESESKSESENDSESENENEDTRLDRLNRWQREGLERAVETWKEVAGTGDLPKTCRTVIMRGPYRGQPCRRPAGQGTNHLGYGRCVAHGGAKRTGRAEGAWLMAHEFSLEYNCSPWEGLLQAVRIAAGKVAYTQMVLSQATDDLELEGRFGRNETGILLHPDTGEPLGAGQLRDRSWWVLKNEVWVDRLARYSKLAIDAGVAERLVDIETHHATHIASVINGMIEDMSSRGVDDELILQMRASMRRQLMALASSEGTMSDTNRTVEGEIAV